MHEHGGDDCLADHTRLSGSVAMSVMVLAVGDVAGWRQAGRSLPAMGDITFAEFCAVTGELLASLKPDIVVSPLVSRHFDCTDLAVRLHRAGYTGRYRAMAPNIPDPSIVKREIVAMCPGLDFEIVQFVPGQAPRIV